MLIINGDRERIPPTEQTVLDWMRTWHGEYQIRGVAVAGCRIPDRHRGHDALEADFVVITPQACVVIEVKGIIERVSGTLSCPANGPWTMPGISGSPVHVRKGDENPLDQVGQGVFNLKNLAHATGLDAFVLGLVLVLPQPGCRLALDKDALPPGIDVLVAGRFDLRKWFHRIARRNTSWSAERAHALLDALHVAHAVTVADLLAEGFAGEDPGGFDATHAPAATTQSPEDSWHSWLTMAEDPRPTPLRSPRAATPPAPRTGPVIRPRTRGRGPDLVRRLSPPWTPSAPPVSPTPSEGLPAAALPTPSPVYEPPAPARPTPGLTPARNVAHPNPVPDVSNTGAVHGFSNPASPPVSPHSAATPGVVNPPSAQSSPRPAPTPVAPAPAPIVAAPADQDSPSPAPADPVPASSPHVPEPAPAESFPNPDPTSRVPTPVPVQEIPTPASQAVPSPELANPAAVQTPCEPEPALDTSSPAAVDGVPQAQESSNPAPTPRFSHLAGTRDRPERSTPRDVPRFPAAGPASATASGIVPGQVPAEYAQSQEDPADPPTTASMASPSNSVMSAVSKLRDLPSVPRFRFSPTSSAGDTGAGAARARRRRQAPQTVGAIALIAVLFGGIWLLAETRGEQGPVETSHQEVNRPRSEEPAAVPPGPAPPVEAPPAEAAPPPAPPVARQCFPFQPGC